MPIRRRRAPVRRRKAPVRRKKRVVRRRAPSYLSRAAGYAGSALRGIGKGIYGIGKYTAKRLYTKTLDDLYSEGPGGETFANIAGLAHSASNYYRRIRGYGDYDVENLGANNSPMGPPQFATKAPSAIGGVRISHREYIQDVQQATSFTIQNFSINPGIFSVFPYVSALAANFEQYKIHGMVFYFRATSGNAVSASNTSLGTVVMATQYNALASTFQNKTQMENYMGAVSGVPTCDLIHPIECESSQTAIKSLYIRVGSVPSGQDARLYDMGVFSLAVVGCQATTGTLGELWCTYDIEFMKPRVVSGAGGLDALTDHFQLSTSVSSSHYLGPDTTTAQTAVATSNIGGSCTNSTYTFPAGVNSGQYVSIYQVTGASTALTNAMVMIPGTNLTTLSLYNSDSTGVLRTTAGATATQQIHIAFQKFNGNTAQSQSNLVYSAGTLPGTISGGDLFISEVAPQLLTLVQRLQRVREDVFNHPLELKKNLDPQDFANLAADWRSQKNERDFCKYVIQRRNMETPAALLEFVHPLDLIEESEDGEFDKLIKDKLETKSNSGKLVRKF
jgi:hypothetical protein